MARIDTKTFGITKAGQTVTAFEFSNDHGMFVRILDYGCTIQSLMVPDKNGKPVDVLVGYDDLASYENGTCNHGAVVGRYANRIGGARFVLDGREYLLEKCIGENNHVHGIFNKKMFDASVEGNVLVLKYLSPAMEEGYPGNVSVEVRYELCEDNSLVITYKATTDEPTIINLTNHSYFNLNGQDGSTILDHKAQLSCSFFTEYAETFEQTGKIIPVDGSPLDLRTEQAIGARFDDDYHQFRICTGYDHNMVVDGKEGELRPIGKIRSEKTGICLEAFTTEPAVHFYSGNYMQFDAVQGGKNGVIYPKNGAFCLEAQHYPDSVNHAHFPSTVLRPGEVYTQKTIYRFSSDS